MTTPTWSAAAAGQPGQAGQINQFLTAHPMTVITTGTSVSSATTDGSASTATNGTYIAQKFTLTGVTTHGRVILTLAKVGAPGVMHVSLRADNAGAPSATEIVGVNVPAEFVSTVKGTLSIPLPASGLTSGGTYWIVITAVGDVSNNYVIERSNQVTGASTSTNGTTWTAQAYGVLYQVFDQSVVNPVVHLWSDSGARWTVATYAATGLTTSYGEYTAGQNGTHQAALRTFTYSNGILQTVV